MKHRLKKQEKKVLTFEFVFLSCIMKTKSYYYQDTPNPEPSLLAQIKTLAQEALATHDINTKIRLLNQIINLSDNERWHVAERKSYAETQTAIPVPNSTLFQAIAHRRSG